MPPAPKPRFTHTASLRDLAAGKVILAVSADNGHPLLLTVDAPFDDTSREYRYTIVEHAFDNTVCFDIEPTREQFSYARQLGTDSWALVRSRNWPPAANISIASRDGSITHSFAAGDAIEHIAAIGDGPLWVSRFDEGGAKNTPLGIHGLIAFDPGGELIYKLPGINFLDCYALTPASPTEVWIHTFSDFNIYRVRTTHPPQLMFANVPVKGAHAFAIHRDRILLFGEYGNKDTLTLLDLKSGKAQALAADLPAPRARRAFARGSFLYVCTEHDLWCTDLAELGA